MGRIAQLRPAVRCDQIGRRAVFVDQPAIQTDIRVFHGKNVQIGLPYGPAAYTSTKIQKGQNSSPGVATRLTQWSGFLPSILRRDRCQCHAIGVLRKLRGATWRLELLGTCLKQDRPFDMRVSQS